MVFARVCEYTISELVKKLFSQLDGLREDNCFLVVQNYDYIGALGGSTGQVATANATMVGAKAGALIGALYFKNKKDTCPRWICPAKDKKAVCQTGITSLGV